MRPVEFIIKEGDEQREMWASFSSPFTFSGYRGDDGAEGDPEGIGRTFSSACSSGEQCSV